MVDDYLSGAGFRVTHAATGKSGLAQAQHDAFDALVLDLMLPDGSGWRLLDTLKATPALAAIPVVVASIKTARRNK